MLQRMFVVGLLGSLPLLAAGCNSALPSADKSFQAATARSDQSERIGAENASKTKKVTVAVSGMT